MVATRRAGSGGARRRAPRSPRTPSGTATRSRPCTWRPSATTPARCCSSACSSPPSALRRRTEIASTVRRNAAPVLTVAVFSPLAYILVLSAMRTAPVALVAPLRESSIVVGSLLAWRLFHEAHLARRLVGAAAVLAGIAAISL
ncbi:EamA family transporter [Streptomyces sp. NPDC047002]|uniref:EamA family transporter n=1 Tax=Streptomyces sp. NPDC047002 TaxID=3155475 RepID=UPI003453C6DF